MKYITKIFIGILALQAFSCFLYAQDINKVLAALEGNMRGLNTVQADFVQTKQMQIFSRPMVIRGSIYLQKPKMFSWRTKSPMQYNLIMRDKIIKQWDAESRQVQEISLTKNPAFEAALSQMKGWFDGDYLTLQKDYQIKIVSESPLTLEFIPKVSSMAEGMMERVNVIFREDMRYISSIEIKEKSGDTTKIQFLNTKIDLPIDPKAWEVKSRVR